MTELEKIQYTKAFIDKLANGVNPIDGTMIPDYELLNNVRISRCLFYVSEVLRNVINNGGLTPKSNSPKLPFFITNEQLSKYPFSDTPITISQMEKNINSLINGEVMKKISHKDITNWLMSIGVLRIDESSDGKKVKRPTENAKSLGITLEERTGMYRTYHVVVYNRAAQEFIINNMAAILKLKSSTSDIPQKTVSEPNTDSNRDTGNPNKGVSKAIQLPDIFPEKL